MIHVLLCWCRALWMMTWSIRKKLGHQTSSGELVPSATWLSVPALAKATSNLDLASACRAFPSEAGVKVSSNSMMHSQFLIQHTRCMAAPSALHAIGFLRPACPAHGNVAPFLFSASTMQVDSNIAKLQRQLQEQTTQQMELQTPRRDASALSVQPIH